MNNIDKKVAELKKEGRLGLMTHAVVGYPIMEESRRIIEILAKESDFLELQIPFSDPIADGPTIMQASEMALKNGMNTDKAFEMIQSMDFAEVANKFFPRLQCFAKQGGQAFQRDPETSGTQKFFGSPQNRQIPILIMCYYNQVYRYGVEKFCRKAKESGVSGLIVPDIPPEEEKNEKFIKTCLTYDLYPIRVVSPASGEERLKINAKYGKGFVYCVSHFGVTGTKTDVNNNLVQYVKRVKKYFQIPIALGFGISNSQQITKIKNMADIAIVGSAIIKNYNDGGLQKVEALVKSLKVATI